MEKVKIKAKSTSMYGKKINLPIDGEVKIDEKGILEVSSECANLLVEKTENYSFIEDEQPAPLKKDNTKKETKEDDDSKKSSKKSKTSKKSKKVEEVEETEEDDSSDESDDSDNEEDEEDVTYTKEDLNALEISDLIEILKEANISEDKYEKFKTKKGLLINFILKTLNNA